MALAGPGTLAATDPCWLSGRAALSTAQLAGLGLVFFTEEPSPCSPGYRCSGPS